MSISLSENQQGIYKLCQEYELTENFPMLTLNLNQYFKMRREKTFRGKRANITDIKPSRILLRI